MGRHELVKHGRFFAGRHRTMQTLYHVGDIMVLIVHQPITIEVRIKGASIPIPWYRQTVNTYVRQRVVQRSSSLHDRQNLVWLPSCIVSFPLIRDDPYFLISKHQLMKSMSLSQHINEIASFLAVNQSTKLVDHHPVDCIAICASQLLLQAETLFRQLEQRPDLTKILLVVGGIGHSTQALYDAVAQHPKYHTLASSITGLPEARILEQILKTYYDVPQITSQGCRILYEDCSTNCGSNAIEAKKVLEANGITPSEIILIQDPTMSLRTCASFGRAYDDKEYPRILGCSLYQPEVADSNDGTFVFVVPSPDTPGLWSRQRFLDLILGEIARLRDDERGYGPNGKNFIKHVDIPTQVEAAYQHILGSRYSSSRVDS